MPYLCKGTSQRVPGMRVGEGAAFLCFYDKFFCHFLPLFQGKKQSNHERTTKRTTSELRENIKNAEKAEMAAALELTKNRTLWICRQQANGNERIVTLPKQTKAAKRWRNHCRFGIYTERYIIRNGNVVLHTILVNPGINKGISGQAPPCLGVVGDVRQTDSPDRRNTQATRIGVWDACCLRDGFTMVSFLDGLVRVHCITAPTFHPEFHGDEYPDQVPVSYVVNLMNSWSLLVRPWRLELHTA